MIIRILMVMIILPILLILSKQNFAFEFFMP
jgi:hypothetical protein